MLVTGGGGFVGRNLAERLAPRHRILAPRRAELDLCDGPAVRAWLVKNPVDVVVHSATTAAHRNAVAPKGEVVAKNLRMFFNLAACDGHWNRFVVIGSGAEYDVDAMPPRVSESAFGRRVPTEESALSKFAISRYAEGRDRFVVLRPFGVFGKYEDWEIRFLSNALCKCLFGKPITLRRNRRFDYVWVDDLARVVEHFLETGSADGRAFNVTDTPVELRAAAELVRRVSGADVEIRVAEEGDGPEYTGDNARLKMEIPGLSFTPLEEAVTTLWKWYADNRSGIRPDALDRDK